MSLEKGRTIKNKRIMLAVLYIPLQVNDHIYISFCEVEQLGAMIRVVLLRERLREDISSHVLGG